jgi:hypothetical protein
MKGIEAYRPASFPGWIHIFLASEDERRHDYMRALSWAKFAGQGAHIYVGPEGCIGQEMLLEPNVGVFKGYLRRCIDEAHENTAKEFREAIAS